jgi:HAD superfamily hydrolase (TIGR01509 family)
MTCSERRVQAIAFDLDGLMFNTEEIYIDVAARMLQRRGHELDMRLIQQMMGRPARVGLPLMIEWYGLSDEVAALEEETQTIFELLLPQSLAPLPGLLELIERVDRLGLPKAIATSSRRHYLDYVLDLAQLPTQFDFVLTAEDVQHGKPDPEIYRRAAQQFGLPPAAMLVLEDSEHGCRAAMAAGAITVAVPGPHNALAKYPGVDLQIDCLNDPRLFSWIEHPA